MINNLEMNTLPCRGGVKRNSSLELLRIIAMWLIVFYHFHFHVLSVDGQLFYKAIMIPLHIGVPLFVLISGYFGISASVKGFAKFVVKVGIYSILLLVVSIVLSKFFDWAYPVSKKQIAGGIFFLSRTNNLWFVRTYVILYLISPFWNKAINGQTIKHRFILIAILFFTSFWLFLFGQAPELSDHSILTFLTIYTIGRTINDFDAAKLINYRMNLFLYLIVTVIVTVCYLVFAKTRIEGIAWLLFFKYNSPFLLLSAFLFFLLFLRKSFYKSWINYISSSTFAVYLLSENSLTNVYIYDLVKIIWKDVPVIPMYLTLAGFVTVIFATSILIDKLLYPVQSCLSSWLERIINSILLKVSKLIPSRMDMQQ